MRVAVWPAGLDACGHNRLIWPAEALAAQGADVHIGEGPQVVWDRYWTGESPPVDARVMGVQKPDADVVVIQRPARRWWSDLIPHLQAHGVRVVVDVDDDFSHIPPTNTAGRIYDPRRDSHCNWDWIARACELADLVTVTTPALARRYGRHGRVQVLPNLVPASYLTVESNDRDGRTLGWTGSIDTHPHDLETTGGTVGRSLERYDWKFRVIGTGHGVPERLRIPSVEASGWQPIEQYPGLYATLDLAIVPLHRSPFNDAKSALKMAEAAALGVPVIASPTPDNARLHREGVGVLAAKPRDWARQINLLMASADLRADLAGHGRQVMADHTYEQHADRWLNAWTARQLVAA